MTEQKRETLSDPGIDILSHPARTDRIFILSLDRVLADDVYERILNDSRMKRCDLVRPARTRIRDIVTEIDAMARDTVAARLLIMDVRRATLPKLKNVYNKIVGYNRRDFNKLCFTILIGDGPISLFQAGKSIDIFVPHLSSHRVDYHPAVFYYDPFLHYEPAEVRLQSIDDDFVLPDNIPRRLVPYFRHDQDIRIDKIRSYLRAVGKPEAVRKKRLKRLRDLYRKRIAEQFPNHKDMLGAWLSRRGVQLASERLHLYPFFFEDWVHDLMKKAARH